ncbi:hypothetical protein BMW24_023315 [Mycobacterium heckeshornense]|uniref:Uncharacterized protein n=1 Tax=Mycobacterium heckeshornense TaxID=110505 RepID=A0A2G8AV56_9MYCO|nr:hypothetical protein [Mycobacterium heckeshornense]KMV15092.1 hypothetical protein ACT16_23095 [Mycobacterium heckeshornense]MCV7034685.1 hypothetical protein [Mycobacterium heckeshornense]PIJ29399.1 hypothetical protein BMW24_023315 [Mycobacterium heckeshornense]BCO34934.1 hypothetical protein MHEC_13670 [Mycobacterium heckeshornense]BCQ08099.1 hypothetical protein JMUB5695_01524 [Mycobacterium heckeshornense]
MTAPAASVWMVGAYALFLAAVAWGFDTMARRVSQQATRWRTGKFVYRPDHDAWVCPQDQWLWPTSFDPHHRVMRYRAAPVVCNSCPVKSTCTTSNDGREITREIDPWPYSDAGRFHRGIACLVAALGVIMPLAMLIGHYTFSEVLVLCGVALLVGTVSLPLARHLWNTPSNAPEHLPHRSALEDRAAVATDRYSGRWAGSWAHKEEPPR